jgi:acyl-CoA synthetase (AMP-forming)/AMP-acid ligase II
MSIKSTDDFRITILQKLELYADKYGDTRPLFTFLNENTEIEASFTYKQLFERSLVMGQFLINKLGLKRGDRVILAYEPSLQFMVAFFACIHFGIIAVPTCPPDPNKGGKEMINFNSIITSSGAKVALSSTVYRKFVKLAEVSKFIVGEKVDFPSYLKWLTTDDLSLKVDDKVLSSIPRENINIDDIAFLQYTSGEVCYYYIK